MPRVPVKLISSRSCICVRRTQRAHPGSRGRDRHKSQPSFLEATRTGGGMLVGIEAFVTPVRGGGGDCSSPLLCRPMRGVHNPTRPVQRLGGGRGCNKFVPVLGGNGTKIAPTGDIFDRTPWWNELSSGQACRPCRQ